MEGTPLSPGLASETAVVIGYDVQRTITLGDVEEHQSILLADVQSEQLAKQALKCRCPADVSELLSISGRTTFLKDASKTSSQLLGSGS